MPILTVRDTAGVLYTAPTITVERGDTTAAVEIDVWNSFDDDPTTTARAPVLMVVARYAGDPAFQLAGIPALDSRIFRFRIIQGVGGLEVDAGPTRALGAGAALLLPAIPQGEGVRVEWWAVVPADLIAPEDLEIRFEVLDAGVELIGDPAYVRHGIPSGLGDPRYSRVIAHGGAVKGTGDGDVDLGDADYILDGAPYAIDAETQTLTDVDGNTDPLDPGESYAALFELTAAGRTVTRGVKSSGVPTAPAPTAGALQELLVTKTEGTALTAPDIDRLYTLARWAAEWTTGLVTFGADQAIADGAHSRQEGEATDALTEGAGQYWWLRPDGIVEATATSTPDTVGALPLYTADVDVAGDASNIVDLRTLQGPVVEWRLPGVLAVDDSDLLRLPGGLACYVDPTSIRLEVGELDVAATTGDLVVILERLLAGTWTAWVTWTVAFDAAALTVYQHTETVQLGGGELVRARVSAIPDQAPTDALVSLRCVGV